MKLEGEITRGTTNPNRLRRCDRWILINFETLFRNHENGMVVDLGYGASPITTVEMADRLHQHYPHIEIVGLEIDPARVANAQSAIKPGLSFQLGGFEIPTPKRPFLIRAFNVLRQYHVDEVLPAWQRLQEKIENDGIIIDGTCDEIGRRSTWITLSKSAPISLTLATRLIGLEDPKELAERLPKILIHRNVQGEKIFHFLEDLSLAWKSNSSLKIFGPRQRWNASVAAVRKDWPISSTGLGELTIAWDAINPLEN